MRETDSIIATLEILADPELAERLLQLAKTIDDDVAAGRLLATADVFCGAGNLWVENLEE